MSAEEVYDQRITVMVSARQRDAMDRLVAQERRSLGFAVREALDAYLDAHPTTTAQESA